MSTLTLVAVCGLTAALGCAALAIILWRDYVALQEEEDGGRG